MLKIYQNSFSARAAKAVQRFPVTGVLYIRQINKSFHGLYDKIQKNSQADHEMGLGERDSQYSQKIITSKLRRKGTASQLPMIFIERKGNKKNGLIRIFNIPEILYNMRN